jgi:nucleotide-binding universal stress UspA family protein
MHRRILVPVDGSALGDHILSFLDHVPERAGVDVVLVRVLPGPGQGEVDWPAAAAHMAKLEHNLSDRGVSAAGLLTAGEPGEGILRVARVVGATMVAMSTHGESGPEGKKVRGSVAEHVLRRCPVPLFLGTAASLPMDPAQGFARILVPLDGSAESARVLDMVGPLATGHGSEVLLVHVEPQEEETSPEELEEILGPHRDRLIQGGVEKVQLLGRSGEESLAILDTVDSSGVDLLAMTSHSRPDPNSRYFGSVAEAVLGFCTCPLLLWRVGPPRT